MKFISFSSFFICYYSKRLNSTHKSIELNSINRIKLNLINDFIVLIKKKKKNSKWTYRVTIYDLVPFYFHMSSFCSLPKQSCSSKLRLVKVLDFQGSNKLKI
jgi:uncharacterized LabA/DUF88 family protein